MKETAYLLQAALISAWWVGLASSSTFFAAFQFADISPTAFWSFFLPDIVLIALLSVIRSYQKVDSINFVILGAFAYSAFFCCNATLLTGTGLLATGMMLFGLAFNVLLCFDQLLFRESKSTSFLANGAKTLIQIFCIWILALIVVPFVILKSFGSIATPSYGALFWLGVAVFAVSSLLGLISAFFMVRDGVGTPLPLDQTNRLVVSGPYRFVRNPMAIAGIGQGIAVATVFYSIPILVYSLLGAAIWHFVVRPIEERDMVKRFGTSYLSYQKRVTCWIPRIR